MITPERLTNPYPSLQPTIPKEQLPLTHDLFPYLHTHTLLAKDLLPCFETRRFKSGGNKSEQISGIRHNAKIIISIKQNFTIHRANTQHLKKQKTSICTVSSSRQCTQE